MVSAVDIISKFALQRTKKFPDTPDTIANTAQWSQTSAAIRGINSINAFLNSKGIEFGYILDTFFEQVIYYALEDWHEFEQAYLPKGYKTSEYPNIKSFCNCLKGVIYYEKEKVGMGCK